MEKMTQQEIDKRNAVIAKFMGWTNIREARPELKFNYDIWQSFKLFENGSLITGIKQSLLDPKYQMVDKLHFHESWDWLIPVIVNLKETHGNWGAIRFENILDEFEDVSRFIINAQETTPQSKQK